MKNVRIRFTHYTAVYRSYDIYIRNRDDDLVFKRTLDEVGIKRRVRRRYQRFARNAFTWRTTQWPF